MLSTEFFIPPDDPNAQETLERQLALWRDSLLDLTRRNPLLALPADGPAHLALPGLTPAALYAALAARRALLLAQDEGPDEADPARCAALTLTRAAFDAWERLRRRARRIAQERGVHPLYAALGVLEWPDPQTRAPLRSPLLLVPVTLERMAGGDALRLRRFDDVLFNPALRFRREQGVITLDLPALPDDDSFDPGTFLQSVQEAVAGCAGWSVAPECVVGPFAVHAFALYRDLETLAPLAARHPVAAAMAGDPSALQRLPAVMLPAPDELDAAPENLHLVLDADPAQRMAILAARRGQSFVLQGPPGTGKSQTIANIIADGMAEGKRILFVAQKAAALESVSMRLRDRGLATFCLDAYGAKSSKKQILEQLRAALEARPPDALLDAERGAARLTIQLNQTVAALHAPRLPLGLSVYEANGLVAGLKDAPDLPFVLAAPGGVTRSEYADLEALAARLAEHRDLLNELATHPWRGVSVERFDAALQHRLRAGLETGLDALEGLEWEAAILARACHLDPPQSVAEADQLLEIVARLQTTPQPPLFWLTAAPEDAALLREEAQAHRERQHSRRAAHAALREEYEETLFGLPLTDLEHRLDDRHEATLQPAFGNDWRAKVARHHHALDQILSSIGPRIARVQRATDLLAESLGMPNAGTIAEAADLLRVAGQVASVQALPGWLTPGALPRLIRRCAEARVQHEAYRAERAALMERYTEGVFLLDLPAMHARFSQEYTGPLRFVNPQYQVEMRVLRSVSKDELPGPGEIVHDLAAARTVLVRRQWISLHEQDLEEAFGSHYEGVQTDWDALAAMLQQAKTFLASFPDQQLPPALAALLTGTAMARRPLADRLEQGKSAFAAFGETLRALGTFLEMPGLPFTDQPLPQALLGDLAAWTETLRAAATDYEDALRIALSVRRTGRPPQSVVHLAGDVAWAAALRRAEEADAKTEPALRTRFGAFHQGPDTDWDRTLAALEWTQQLRAFFPETALPAEFAALVHEGRAQTPADLADQATRVRMRRAFLREAMLPLQELLPAERLQSQGHALETLRYGGYAAWLNTHLDRLPDLERWIDVQALRRDCERLGVLSFFETLAHHATDADAVVPAFRKRFHRIWLDGVLDADAVLRAFRGREQDARIARFAAQDARQVESAADDVRAQAQARRPTALFTVGEAALLRAQTHRKRPAPVRSLLAQMPHLLACLKPCLMMSLASVSLVLDPERIDFDLVIFDEASQVPAQDALGALLRAPQVIVAGDSRQLGPGAGMDGDAEDPDEDGRGPSLLDTLDAFASEESPHFARRALTWHYRSRDESLIAFARRHVYPSLTAFPAARPDWSVTFEHVPNGVHYGERGGRGDNPVEAGRVAELITAWARAHPSRSLGVVTFGEAQRLAVERAIAAKSQGDPDLRSLLDEDGPEGFFVKTAAEAQGDERDAVFLSVGYALGADVLSAQRFGALGQEGGERLLTVAITRARRACVVVSSLLPTDIASDRLGPRLLREYLEYARGGALLAARSGETMPALSAFELAVEAALLARGHRVRRQVGMTGRRVALAVMDPDDPAHAMLGIECDGPAYRDVPTASMRDRCRADLLRGRGWHLIRVWSGDWVRNADAEIARIEAALQPDDAPSLAASDPPRLVLVEGAAPSLTASLPPGVTLYERAATPLAGGAASLFGADEGAREEFLCSVVGLEGPLCLDAAAQSLAHAAGLERAGRRVRSILEDSVDAMIEKGILEQRESFLWTRGARAPARVPRASDLPRPLNQVALEEIGEVALAALRAAFGMRRDDLVGETARLLGDAQLGAKARARIQEALSLLETEHRITVQNGQLRPLDG